MAASHIVLGSTEYILCTKDVISRSFRTFLKGGRKRPLIVNWCK